MSKLTEKLIVLAVEQDILAQREDTEAARRVEDEQIKLLREAVGLPVE